MKTKKIAIVSVFIMFFGILTTSSALAGSIEGTKCSKRNATKKVSGINYYCNYRNGDKLIWQRDYNLSPVVQSKTFQEFNICVEMNYMPQMDSQLDKVSQQNAYFKCSDKLPSFKEQSKMQKGASNYLACVKARYIPQLNATTDMASKQNAYLQCSNLKP